MHYAFHLLTTQQFHPNVLLAPLTHSDISRGQSKTVAIGSDSPSFIDQCLKTMDTFLSQEHTMSWHVVQEKLHTEQVKSKVACRCYVAGS